MLRILGEDPEAGEDAALPSARRWTVPSQSIAGRSPSNARSRSLNKVGSGPPSYNSHAEKQQGGFQVCYTDMVQQYTCRERN